MEELAEDVIVHDSPKLWQSIMSKLSLKRMSDYLNVPAQRLTRLRWTMSQPRESGQVSAERPARDYTAIVCIVTGVFLLSNTFAVTSGYFYRDHELLSNMKTDDNALVIGQVGPRTFALLDENGTKWSMHVCEESVLPPFKSGMHVKITYERAGNCMRVSGGHLGYWINP